MILSTTKLEAMLIAGGFTGKTAGCVASTTVDLIEQFVETVDGEEHEHDTWAFYCAVHFMAKSMNATGDRSLQKRLADAVEAAVIAEELDRKN